MDGEYQRGFNDGFSAAIERSEKRTSFYPAGYRDDAMRSGQHKISIAFPDDVFSRIRDLAAQNNRSFAAEVRQIVTSAPALFAALNGLVEHVSHNDENGHWSCWEDARRALDQARCPK